MYALPYAEDVSLVHGVPQARSVAQMGLTCHEELESDIFRPGRVRDDFVWFVVWFDEGADAGGGFFDVLREGVVALDLTVGPSRTGGGGGGRNEGFREMELVDVGFD